MSPAEKVDAYRRAVRVHLRLAGIDPVRREVYTRAEIEAMTPEQRAAAYRQITGASAPTVIGVQGGMVPLAELKVDHSAEPAQSVGVSARRPL